MDDVLIIGAGPAGLLAAWVAAQNGRRVRVLASGIGSTHVSPGWIGVLDTEKAADKDAPLAAAVDAWAAAHPEHPYALVGAGALAGGIAALRAAAGPVGIDYLGDLSGNYRLPTAAGALVPAALAPASLAAGDAHQPGDMMIAGPAHWRDFYPALCAANLSKQGIPAHGETFDLPQLHSAKFDATATGLARLFDQAEVRAAVAAQLKPRLNGAARAGLPAVLGLEHSREAWADLQDRLGVPVFEIPTLPPSVPGIRLFNAFKTALAKAGVQLLLDMTVARGIVEGTRATGVAVPGAVRELTYNARHIVLATGGLYGGGIATDYRGGMTETVFGLPVFGPDTMNRWFDDTFLNPAGHEVYYAGLRADAQMRPLDAAGRPVLENVAVAGRLLGGYNPLIEGSTEGVWLATGYKAATCI
jgi:glycerol-3-phosphate dehydrogenase subunit B